MKKLLTLFCGISLITSSTLLTSSCWWTTTPPSISRDPYQMDEWYSTPLSKGLIELTDSIKNITFSNSEALILQSNQALKKYIDKENLIFNEDIFYKFNYYESWSEWEEFLLKPEEIGKSKELYCFYVVKEENGKYITISQKFQRIYREEENAIYGEAMFLIFKQLKDLTININ
ncbi:hypothetical protein [Spiroplasma cantharicola]|uniref:Lipoprotein n=1 Tax=Spiroplasma cantharicola TaxID=362837 RepID=A0A0M4JID7_9MOLU|nr:hypothetical protein [Spiroplasma cantharicola]ALD66353.1 hypothetical protein SCANT_v1c04470 [Spiroplasma cantharicola]